MASIGTKFARLNLFSSILHSKRQEAIRSYNQLSNGACNSEGADDNVDKIMNENDELAASNNNCSAQSQEIAARNSDGGIMAPLDVNSWVDEELEKGGTTDMEYIEKERAEIHYPEPPKERSGYYEFEGIKIWLPKRMLTPATYRYRLTEEEQQTLPDDIRVCKFEKFKPTS